MNGLLGVVVGLLSWIVSVQANLITTKLEEAPRAAPPPIQIGRATNLTTQAFSATAEPIGLTTRPAALTIAAAPSPTPSPNATAEALFARAKAYWQARTDVPYLRYGALIRYEHNRHVFDNWWDAYERTSDKTIGLTPLLDPVENNRRISGVPFSIFGVKIFDTNPDAEPVRLDEPRIDPTSSFGVAGSSGNVTLPEPAASGLPELAASAPSPAASGELREITSVAVSSRAYQIELAGSERLDGVDALHLTLVPLREPAVNRLRDLWLDPTTYRTIQLNVQGILNGKPYDAVEWTVRYTLVEGREYLQQLVADEPLHFGLDTTLPRFEYDFVDYHFPPTVPQFTFDRPF
jgi:hypothetical protein